MDLWSKVINTLKNKISQEELDLFIKPLKYISYISETGTLTFSAPEEFPEQFINGAYKDIIAETFKTVHNFEIKKINIVKREKTHKKELKEKKEKNKNADNLLKIITSSKKDYTYSSFYVFQLREEFTFENFIVGDSNRMAVAAAKQLLNYPNTEIKTLYIYGMTGVGKTHLAQAIGNYFLKNKKEYKAVYVPSERFVNDYVSALKMGNIDEFREFYRSADIFLLDDVQFFQGKEKSQEEIFHTYEFLRNEGKAIVLCSDRQLSKMDMESRLVSRLSQHFIVDIKPPDELTLRAIIKKKCELHNFTMPEEVEEGLANSGITSIRMIEGIISNLKWLAKNGQKIDLAVLKETIAKVKPNRNISSEQIIKIVSNILEIPIEEIKGSSRQKDVAFARQIAMYVIRLTTNKTLQEIARIFGKKDHSTVLHAIKKIKSLISENSHYNDIYRHILQQLDLSDGGI